LTHRRRGLHVDNNRVLHINAASIEGKGKQTASDTCIDGAEFNR
jgi:hypothetical protein